MFGGSGGAGAFTFGTATTQAQTTSNAPKPFNFGTGTGFSFGTQPTSAASTTAPTSLFSTPAGGANTVGFSFGVTNPASTAAPTSAAGSFSLGAATATPQTASTTGFTLGGAQQKPGGFSFGAPATSTAAPTMSGTGFKLGASTSAPGIRPTATPTVTPAGSFTFGPAAAGGAAQKPTLAVPASTTTPATSGSLNFGFGAAQQPTTQTSTATKHTLGGAPAPSQPTFGSIKLGTTSAAATTTTSAAPSTGFTLGGTATTTTASTGLNLGTTATSTTAPSGGLGFSFGAVAAKASPATSASTAAPAGAPSKLPQMNYRQLEECINKWTVELQEQEKIFLQQATQVNAWDRLLTENGEKIAQVNSDSERVKMDQQRLDNELDFIRAQQRELEELLSPLESAVQQLPSISYQQHADLEREHTYQMAENIDAQLKRMVQDLKDIIDHVNSTNSSQDNTDPIQQITKILNAHMDSLQWIDQNSNLLSRRVEDISKQMDLQRKEQERNFRLAYD
ncbi:nuclear pore glycoprotein p62-like [Liolophura sinensis]|uniref:nuclear pore glycoprotein p62-like n=1 Tax=Liolophura sinensis TaxID=3198878 RepID=UPI0031589C76